MWKGKCLQAQMIAGFTRGTQQEPLPLLPSGPGGVHGVPLREARLSCPPANETELDAGFEMTTKKTG